MARDGQSDLANELNGAGELLLALTANGENRDAQLTKLFVSFNARVSKLPPVTPDATVTAITDAIESGPWTDRQKAALTALAESVTRPVQRADEKPFQHALRCTMCDPLPSTRVARASCARDAMLHYTYDALRARACARAAGSKPTSRRTSGPGSVGSPSPTQRVVYTSCYRMCRAQPTTHHITAGSART